MKDPYDDPEFREFAEHVRKEVAPAAYKSHVSVTFVPDDPTQVDVKFAVELGLMVMYGKPIVAVIAPGTKVSEKMAKVVDRFIELGDFNDPKQREYLAEEIRKFAEEFCKDE